MAIYTFYLCTGDGSSTSFEAFELGGDEFAPARALKMLREHPSCAYVTVWCEERSLAYAYREELDDTCLGPNSPVGNPSDGVANTSREPPNIALHTVDTPTMAASDCEV